MLVELDHLPKDRGEHKKSLKPAPSKGKVIKGYQVPPPSSEISDNFK